MEKIVKWVLIGLASSLVIVYVLSYYSEQGVLVVDENSNYYIVLDNEKVLEFTIAQNMLVIPFSTFINVSGMKTGDHILVGLWEGKYETSPGCLSRIHYLIRLKQGDEATRMRAIKVWENSFFSIEME